MVFQYFSKLLARRFPSTKIPLKMLWQASQMLQRRFQDAPGGSQDALKTVQEAPKTTQEAAKMLSEASAWLLRCSKRFLRGSRRLQEAPKRPPRGFQEAPRGSQEVSKMAPRGLHTLSHSVLESKSSKSSSEDQNFEELNLG